MVLQERSFESIKKIVLSDKSIVFRTEGSPCHVLNRVPDRKFVTAALEHFLYG